MNPSLESRFRRALYNGVAMWLLPKAGLDAAIWDKLQSIVAVYVGAQRQLRDAVRDGTLPQMMAEARKMAGPAGGA